MPAVLHINTRADHGGAAQAALLLHRSLNRLADISSRCLVGRGAPVQAMNVIGLGVPRWKLYANVLAFRAFGLDGPLNLHHWDAVEPLIETADIVHLHNVHGYYMPHSVLERILSKPVVWTLHDFWLGTGRRGFPPSPLLQQNRAERLWPWGGYDYPTEWFDRSERRKARTAKLLSRYRPVLVAPTRDMKERLTTMGVPGAQVIHHGIFCDPSPQLSIGRIELRRRLGWPQAKRIMLFVAAQIDDQLKGWTILERAIHRLRKPERWHLMIVGNDRKGVVRTSSYPVRTTLLGPLTRLEVMECFHAADLYVNPTLGETFGLTTLEALGEGTDVLCSNLAVLQEIAGSAATVFPTGSSDVLAAKLDDYQPVMPEARFSRAARIRERFLTQRMAERYRTLYQTVLLSRRSHGS